MIERSEGTGVYSIVLFCSLQHAHGIIKAAQTNKEASKFVWLLSDSFDTTKLDTNNICIMTVQMQEDRISRNFKKYLNEVNMRDPKWRKHSNLIKFWEEWFNCSLGNTSSNNNQSCTGSESYHQDTAGFSFMSIMTAVYAYAHGIHSLQKELCGDQAGMCPKMMRFKRSRLLQHLRNVSYENFLNTSLQFDENGEVTAIYHIYNFHQLGASKFFKFVGEWDGHRSANKLKINIDDIMWFKAGNGSIPQSYCSADCKFGYVKKEREGYPFEYCWNCQQCDKLQLIINNTCITGEPGFIPNTKRDKWMKREVLYLKWSDTLSIIITVLSGIFGIVTLAVLLTFLIKYENRTVKASGRELSCIILIGILLCFITSYIFIAKPSEFICCARIVAPGFALSMIYSALFMKINRVYRVFTSAKFTKQRPPLVRPKSQIMITFALVSIQILITILGLLTNMTHASENYYSDEEKLIMECNIDSTTYVGSLAYVMILMILSTIYAFKTRKFPRNFNESKYIAITLYTTLATFIIFFAFYLNMNSSINEAAFSAFGTLVIGILTLSGLFGQRLIIIFCVKDTQAEDTFITRNQSSGEISRSPVIMDKQRNSTPVPPQTTVPATSVPQTTAPEITSRKVPHLKSGRSTSF